MEFLNFAAADLNIVLPWKQSSGNLRRKKSTCTYNKSVCALTIFVLTSLKKGHLWPEINRLGSTYDFLGSTAEHRTTYGFVVLKQHPHAVPICEDRSKALKSAKKSVTFNDFWIFLIVKNPLLPPISFWPFLVMVTSQIALFPPFFSVLFKATCFVVFHICTHLQSVRQEWYFSKYKRYSLKKFQFHGIFNSFLNTNTKLTFWTSLPTKSWFAFTDIRFHALTMITMLRANRNTTCTIRTSSISLTANLYWTPFWDHLKNKICIIGKKKWIILLWVRKMYFWLNCSGC